MKIKSQVFSGIALSFGVLLSACSNQHAGQALIAPTAVIQPPVLPSVIAPPVKQPPKVAKMIPAPAPALVPYRDIVVAPAKLQPVLKPAIPPAPLIKPAILPVATILPPAPVMPKIKAKGVYRGTVPVDGTLRQQYQQ